MLEANDIQANYKSGWIRIYRSIRKHWLYPKNRPLTELEAWITILIEVNHESEKVRIGYEIYECNKGEKYYSLDTWAKIFHWNKSKVRRFFILLQNDLMIELKSVQKTTHLIVCNYDTYQSMRNDNETIVKRKRNDGETMVKPIEEYKNIKNENNDKNIYVDFLNKFNYILQRKYKVLDDKTKRQLNARIKEGFTIEDILLAAKNCSKDQYHLENPQYLTPEFITRPDKLQKYLNVSTDKKQTFIQPLNPL